MAAGRVRWDDRRAAAGAARHEWEPTPVEQTVKPQGHPPLGPPWSCAGPANFSFRESPRYSYPMPTQIPRTSVACIPESVPLKEASMVVLSGRGPIALDRSALLC